jgi:hypothetical protein
MQQTFKEFEWLVEINTTGKPDFNAVMNKMLRRSKGQLIVSLQDHIAIRKDGLEQFYRAYKEDNTKNTAFTAPVGKTIDGSNIKWDWRYTDKEECSWMEWEIDWGAAPREAFFDAGGFDEELDKHWGFDNVNLGLRFDILGVKVRNLPRNFSVAYDHDAAEKHPFRKLRNPDFHNQRLQEIRQGKKLTYL